MNRWASGLAIIAAALALGGADEAPLGEEHAPRVTELGARAIMVEGYGGNAAVVATGEGLVFADSFFAESAPGLIAEAETRLGEEARLVVNTHHHGDHSMGDGVFHAEGALSIAHEFARTRVSERRYSELREAWVEPREAELRPRIAYDGAMELRLGAAEIALIHPPAAHTAGDTIVHFVDADVIATGDIFIHGVWPIIDIYAGGSTEGTLAALDLIVELAGAETAIVPGHGPVATRDDVAAYRAALAEMRDAVAMLAADGLDADAIAAADPLAAMAPDWRAWFVSSADVARNMAIELAGASD